MEAKALYLGIDFGTSVFKVGLYTQDGILRGLGKSELHLDVTEPLSGRYELAVSSFWSQVSKCLEMALEQAGATTADIAAISYASQANSFLMLDAHDRALTNIIFWSDQRGAGYVEALHQKREAKRLLQALGLDAFSAEMLAAKCRWFQKEKPAVWWKCDKILTISDYFIYALTGRRVGDQGTASLLGLWDPQTKSWHPEALKLFQIPATALSSPIAPGSFAGITSGPAGRQLGLPADMPVFVGSLDHHVGGIVPLNTFNAEVSISLGTVVAAIMRTDTFLPRRGVITGPDFEKGHYYQLSFSNFGASWIKRFKDEVAPRDTWDDFLAEGAARTHAVRDRLRVDVGASTRENRIIFVGGEAGQSRGDCTAAVLLAIASEIKTLVGFLRGETVPASVGICGGGTQNPVWDFMLADVLGTHVRSLPGTEFGCLGAAVIAIAGVHGSTVSEIARSISQNLSRKDPCESIP